MPCNAMQALDEVMDLVKSNLEVVTVAAPDKVLVVSKRVYIQVKACLDTLLLV